MRELEGGGGRQREKGVKKREVSCAFCSIKFNLNFAATDSLQKILALYFNNRAHFEQPKGKVNLPRTSLIISFNRSKQTLQRAEQKIQKLAIIK